MKRVGLRSGSWSVSGLPVMGSFVERFRGIRIPGMERGLVIRRAAVHTLGLSEALEVFAVDGSDRVVEVRTLAPNRLAWFRGAKYVVELPACSEVPAVGSVVEMTYGR